ncbi:FAD-binding oxidoreductase [Chitinophaga qingshengii]|uniref:FAD-binding oxidoreductase n=1 Tax=Chitinophaga qingshengii TaxID=1569794 RepID=A0ABR7TUT1_9BACT|nr:FAD-binding oxidoreductase [Chitinophaga qingshengii]MBC9933149.1 FAD-binding oxidoreductase [Chitinophaga qingshengii]
MEKITPADIRYTDLAEKRFNKRYLGKPEYIGLPVSTAEVVNAVQEAVSSKRRLVVRSGGHCLEGFVADPAVQVVIDMSLMTEVSYDKQRAAFMVEAGCTVGEMYRRLFLGWGVVLPAGEHPGVGAGGHILGGAFGFLCREYGLAADYLYGVEVVTVDSSGKAHSVIATRENDDANRELWWAHTGGGGGNFGIVTRYWLRSPDATGNDPHSALPKAPSSVTTFRVSWDWQDFDETAFQRLAKNFGTWCQQNSSPDSSYLPLFSILFLNHRNIGKLDIKGLCTGAHARQLIDDHLAAVAVPVGIPYSLQVEETPWLRFALNPFPELFQPGMESVAAKVKDAFFRQPLTDNQIATAYHYLTAQVPIGGMLGMATYGGKVNSIAPDATASAQRDCIMDVACNTGWLDPQGAAPSLTWVRHFFRDLFAGSGGVPVPNEQTDGAMVNHPDTDLADPDWNKSGIPWYTLYYKDNYPRLQRVKKQWDPLNIFHHALSIRPA